jgi:hypothetical protein
MTSKLRPKIEMVTKVRFLTEKLTKTPPTDYNFKYFWMQYIDYCPKECI